MKTPAELLQDHIAARPEMPRPYDPRSKAGIEWHRQFTAWADRKAFLTRCVEMGLPADEAPKPRVQPVSASFVSEPNGGARRCHDCSAPAMPGRSRCERHIRGDRDHRKEVLRKFHLHRLGAA